MIYSLAEYEFIKNVKITLNSGEVVYCDIEEWIDDDPEEITVKPNQKTTNEWLIGRILMGMSLNITEISDIMLLGDRKSQSKRTISSNLPNSKDKYNFHVIVARQWDYNYFLMAEVFLDNFFSNYTKETKGNGIIGDYCGCYYSKDGKEIKLEMNLMVDEVWIDSNFKFETPDFLNEVIYKKEYGNISNEQRSEISLIYYLAYPDFHIDNYTECILTNRNDFIRIYKEVKNEKWITFVSSNMDIKFPTLEEINNTRYLSSFSYIFAIHPLDKYWKENLHLADGCLNVDVNIGTLSILGVFTIVLTEKEREELKEYAKARDFLNSEKILQWHERQAFDNLYYNKDYTEDTHVFFDEARLFFKCNYDEFSTVLILGSYLKNDFFPLIDLIRKCHEIMLNHYGSEELRKETKEERNNIKYYLDLYNL